MARRTTAEGGLARQTRGEQVVDLRAQERALEKDLAAAREEVHRIVGALKKVRREKDWSLDNFHQPDLPFPNDNGNGQANGEYTP